MSKMCHMYIKRSSSVHLLYSLQEQAVYLLVKTTVAVALEKPSEISAVWHKEDMLKSWHVITKPW